MRKTVLFTALGATLAASLVSAQAPLRVGVVFNTGGKNDRSFNQRANEGAVKAAKSFGIKLSDFEPADPSDIARGVNQMAQGGLDLIVGVGFNNEPAITAAAAKYPKTKFAVLDAMPKGTNTIGLIFREHEASFLVGYVAGKSSSTGVVGFIGGMDIPLIHKFDAGFKAGVKRACPSCTVYSQYIGNTPAAWNDPSKAKEIAAGMAAKGADIMYAAAGGSGAGLQSYVKSVKCVRADRLPAGVKFRATNIAAKVPKAADYAQACAKNNRPMFFIGVDSNQNYLGDSDNNPATMNYALTSMEKRMDTAIYSLISDVRAGKVWQSGGREFGLADFGVGYAVDEYNKALIPAGVIAEIAKIKGQIASGKIVVPVK
jgi:basic membrane protein A and related proteins